MFLNLFDLAIKNPLNKKARVEHDAKPESNFFEDKPNKLFDFFNRDGKITFGQAKRLGEALGEEMEKYDYPSQLKEALIDFCKGIG